MNYQEEALKRYVNQPTTIVTSNTPETEVLRIVNSIRNHFVSTLPTGEVTTWDMICWAKDFTIYMDGIIHEAECKYNTHKNENRI